MSPVHVSNSMSQTTCAFDGDLTDRGVSSVQRRDNEVAISEEASSIHDAGQHSVLELAALKEKDPTHILLRRRVKSGALCLDLESNFLERDEIVLRQMVERGDPDLEEYNEKFMARLSRYHRFGCQFRKVLDLDEPSQVFLDSVLSLARSKWDKEQRAHLNAEAEDWAPLYGDKLDQLSRFCLHHPLPRRMMRAFGFVSGKEGEIKMTFIPWGYGRFALVGLFNCFVGVLVSAPVAILTIKSMSPGVMIATYLAFVVVAGFLIQSFVKSFTKQLLVYLAYASVLAAVMRLKD